MASWLLLIVKFLAFTPLINCVVTLIIFDVFDASPLSRSELNVVCSVLISAFSAVVSAFGGLVRNHTPAATETTTTTTARINVLRLRHHTTSGASKPTVVFECCALLVSLLCAIG